MGDHSDKRKVRRNDKLDPFLTRDDSLDGGHQTTTERSGSVVPPPVSSSSSSLGWSTIPPPPTPLSFHHQPITTVTSLNNTTLIMCTTKERYVDNHGAHNIEGGPQYWNSAQLRGTPPSIPNDKHIIDWEWTYFPPSSCFVPPTMTTTDGYLFSTGSSDGEDDAVTNSSNNSHIY